MPCFNRHFAHKLKVRDCPINGIDPIGGVRIHQPSSAGELPLHEELMDYINMKEFRVYSSRRLSEGITHGGKLWIDPNCRLAGLAADLARRCFVMFLATQAKWYLGAGNQYVQDAWASLRWYAAPKFQTFPYPDNRYDSYVLCGLKDIWPSNFKRWAAAQIDGEGLDGPAQ